MGVGRGVPDTITRVSEGAAGASAAAHADASVDRVRDHPEGRLALLRRLYELPPEVDRGYLPYRRAASAFLGWQLRRGLLNPPTAEVPGSPWWRAVNDALLRDTSEARELALGRAGEARTRGVEATLEFIRAPTARSWYRAHNLTIASGFLAHEPLACQEGRVERFFVNLVLIRVLYAHALVAAPRMALGWLAPAGRLLGDPRLGMTGIFLSLSRVLPDDYPLGEDLTPYTEAEHSLGHLLDVGILVPRLTPLFDWSAEELGLPGLTTLLDRTTGTPTYAWDAADSEVWHPAPSRSARLARWLVPGPGRAPG